jgi:hypothetical protein
MRYIEPWDEAHEHRWSDTVEVSFITGTPHLRCLEYGCKVISLDLDDPEEDIDEIDRTEDVRSRT